MKLNFIKRAERMLANDYFNNLFFDKLARAFY